MQEIVSSTGESLISNILKDLLMTLAKGETSLEQQRQTLCSMGDFSPQSAFEKIQVNGIIS